MSEARWCCYADRASWAAAAAADFAEVIGAALVEQESVLAALPGGTTPIAICRQLAALPLEWSRVILIPGDERCVPEDDPLSNLGLLRRVFAATGAEIRALDEVDALPWPPALVWLGVGSDGHTASIFPGPDLAAALISTARMVAVRPDPLPAEAPVARLTLTCTAINSAGALRLVFAGADKKAVVERALAEGLGPAYPVGQVLAQATRPVILHWCR